MWMESNDLVILVKVYNTVTGLFYFILLQLHNASRGRDVGLNRSFELSLAFGVHRNVS